MEGLTSKEPQMLRKEMFVYGPEVPYVPAHLHFGRDMLTRMKLYEHQLALINADTGETVTFGELSQKTVDIALSLARIGVRKEDVVSICSEKRMEIMPTVLGVICAGGVYSPLDETYGAGYIGVENTCYLDSAGFYKTGDVGYYDEDQYFYVVSRVKELIKYKDSSFAPAEFEAILMKDERVLEAGVTAEGGEVAALVVLHPHARATPDEILEYLHSQITYRIRLEGGVYFVKSLLRGAGDKLDRRALHALLIKQLEKK